MNKNQQRCISISFPVSFSLAAMLAAVIGMAAFFLHFRQQPQSGPQNTIEFCSPAYACVAGCSDADRKAGKDCCDAPTQDTKDSKAGKKAAKKEAEKKGG